MRNPKFTDEAWNSYIYSQTQDRKTLKRINDLIKDAQRSPSEWIGKPEAWPDNANFAGRRRHRPTAPSPAASIAHAGASGTGVTGEADIMPRTVPSVQ